MHSLVGKGAQQLQGNDNFKNFQTGVSDAISDINDARGKVNDWINENKTSGSAGVQGGHSSLAAADVYKAYGMSNDAGLKNFSPEGNAVPVFKSQNTAGGSPENVLDGFMIKGKQTNPRTGEMSDKQMFVSSKDFQKSDGAIGQHGEWTASTNSGFHQLTPDVYAYDVAATPSKSGGKGQAQENPELAEQMSNARNSALNFMDGGAFYPTYMTVGGGVSAPSHSVNTPSAETFTPNDTSPAVTHVESSAGTSTPSYSPDSRTQTTIDAVRNEPGGATDYQVDLAIKSGSPHSKEELHKMSRQEISDHMVNDLHVKPGVFQRR
jgi:hypothetical protein